MAAIMPTILLDLNSDDFQRGWFALEKEDALAIFATLRKIQRLDWPRVYSDPGLRWEKIRSAAGPGGAVCYSIRITRRVRAVAYRDVDFLRFVSIHPDHDSAYEK